MTAWRFSKQIRCISPSQVSYGMSIVSIGEKINSSNSLYCFMSGIMQRKGIMSSVTFALAHGIVWSLSCKQGPWIPSTAYKQTYTNGRDALTPKQLGHFFPKIWFYFLMLFTMNVISLYETVSLIQWIFLSVLWLLMPWCFSIRASVATVMNTHSCVSSC